MGKMISLDNGASFMTAAEAMQEIERNKQEYGIDLWDAIVSAMDDEIREKVHAEMPETELEFLQMYLKEANDDLIIG